MQHSTWSGFLAGQAQQFGDVDTTIDAGNEELVAQALAQQGQPGIEPLGPAGQHDDGVGMGGAVLDRARNVRREADEADQPHDEQDQRRPRPEIEEAAEAHGMRARAP
jgi:hypothetical protein